MSEILGGCKVDPVDLRDGLHCWEERYSAHEPVEAAVDLWLPNQLVRTQEGQSCTGFATQYAFRMATYHETGIDLGELSGMFSYYTGRSVWGGHRADAGSYLRDGALKALQIQGICIEKVFSDQVPWAKPPTWRATKNAMQNRGMHVYRQIRSEEQARAALSKGKPIVGGWRLGADFLNWKGGEAFSGESNPRGGHAMAVSGYNEAGDFIIANSWGVASSSGGVIGDPDMPGFWRMTPEALMSAHSLYTIDMVP